MSLGNDNIRANQRHLVPREMPYFYLRKFGQQDVVCNPPESVSQALIFFSMKRNDCSHVGTKLQVEVSMPGLVRVKSYIRIQNGKAVKVRSYNRRPWEAKVVSVRISTN